MPVTTMAAITSGGYGQRNLRRPRRANIQRRNIDDDSGTEMQTTPRHTQTVRSMLDIGEARSRIEWEIPSRPHSRERPQVPDEEMGPAFGQALSFATTRSEKIYEDIISCQYECPICADEIIHDDPMWNCSNCHHVYHFTCIKSWSTNKPYPWICPTCKIERGAAPQARCWCGKSPHSDELHHGNCCGEICRRIRKCNSTSVKCMDICSKICHPGPCELPVCHPLCETVKTPVVTIVHSGGGRGAVLGGESRPHGNYRVHGAYNTRTGRGRAARPTRPSWNITNARQEEQQRNAEPLDMAKVSGADLVASWFGLLFMNFAFAIWVYFNVDLQTKPLEHKGFIQYRSQGVHVVAAFFSVVLVGINGTLGYIGARAGKNILWKEFHLDVPTISCWKPLLKTFFSIVLLGYFLGVAFWFPMAFYGTPAGIYYKQMRHTCEGFDTRARLSGGPSNLPTSHLSLYNPTLNPGNRDHPSGIDEFDLLSITQETIPPSSPFHKYTRVSGTLSPNNTFAIDFDIQHHMYRTVTLDVPSSNSTSPVINNGTWTPTTSKMPHAFLPELGLMIKDLHSFTKHCRFQPYITIFSTSNMSQAEIDEQVKEPWSSKSEKNVVARTAAFGHQPRNMQVCARREDYTVRSLRDVEEVNEGVRRTGVLEWEKEEVRRGLGGDGMVPIGLLAVLGREMREEGRYWEECGWNTRI